MNRRVDLIDYVRQIFLTNEVDFDPDSMQVLLSRWERLFEVQTGLKVVLHAVFGQYRRRLAEICSVQGGLRLTIAGELVWTEIVFK